MTESKKISPLAILIKKHRALNGHSQADFAKLLGYSSRQHISNIERGEPFSFDTIGRMVTLLKIPQREVLAAIQEHFQLLGEKQCRIFIARYRMT